MFTKLIKNITEIIAWLAVFASPFLVSLFIGTIIYLSTHNPVFAIIVLAIGIVIGFFFAEKTRKKHGSVNFISKIYSTPELDKLEKKDLDKNKK